MPSGMFTCLNAHGPVQSQSHACRHALTHAPAQTYGCAHTRATGYRLPHVAAFIAGMWENTIFVVMGDNGGPTFEAHSNTPLRGGKLNWHAH